MKLFVQTGLLGLAALLGASGVSAQVYDRNEPYYRNNEPYYRNSDRGNYSGSIIDQVQADLSRAAAYSYTDNHERGHFNQAQQALQDFQNRWARGRFDKGPLDRAATSLQHLVNSDQLDERDRSILANDLNALRQFRSSGGYNRSNRDYPPQDYRRRY